MNPRKKVTKWADQLIKCGFHIESIGVHPEMYQALINESTRGSNKIRTFPTAPIETIKDPTLVIFNMMTAFSPNEPISVVYSMRTGDDLDRQFKKMDQKHDNES